MIQGCISLKKEANFVATFFLKSGQSTDRFEMTQRFLDEIIAKLRKWQRLQMSLKQITGPVFKATSSCRPGIFNWITYLYFRLYFRAESLKMHWPVLLPILSKVQKSVKAKSS